MGDHRANVEDIANVVEHIRKWILEKTIVNSTVSETLLKNMWEDCNVDDVLYVLGNLQKRDMVHEYRQCNSYAIVN